MTLIERFEEMREQLFHSHREEPRAEMRHEREHERHELHHVDLASGSEFLDVM